jgi:hypothetical protein
MRGCGIPRGFWLKPGGSVDRVEGIIIETFVILCQYNSQIHRVPAGRIVTNKQTRWWQRFDEKNHAKLKKSKKMFIML